MIGATDDHFSAKRIRPEGFILKEGLMRILVIGANGQLGTDLARRLAGQEVIPLTHQDIEVCDHARTREILQRHAPQVVINTAAYHRVDLCEDHVEKSFQVNAYAVRNLALVCRDLDGVLVHFSTDYVFDGQKRTPYSEEDTPNPLNVYGVSKLTGEYFLRNIWPKHLLVRTCGLYGRTGARSKGGNFVETMIQLASEGKPIRVVNDQVLTPSFTEDVAEMVCQLLQRAEWGLYHVTNEGECSWYEFAQTIFALLGHKANLASVTTEEFGARAPRPAYSVLAKGKIREMGLPPLRPWQEALCSYLTAKGYLRMEKLGKALV